MHPLALLLSLTAPLTPPHPDPVLTASHVLHGWDRQRAAAWATGDETALRRLYVPGSAAGAGDVALLRRYAARGLVVRRLEQQVFGLVVVHLDDHLLRVRVRERVAGGEVDDGQGVAPLRASPSQVHDVVLRRTPTGWRVVSARQVTGSARAPR